MLSHRDFQERLFGLSGPEGNHGEDCKELYFLEDSTPTHSYARMRLAYPFDEFPYQSLVEENARRGLYDPEFELLDALPEGQETLRKGHLWNIAIEYCKGHESDILCRVTARNPSHDREETLHILPQAWFRNTWSWGYDAREPVIQFARVNEASGMEAAGYERHMGAFTWSVSVPKTEQGDGMSAECTRVEPLLTDNETNFERLYGPGNWPAGASRKAKDAFHTRVAGDRGSSCYDSAATRDGTAKGSKAATWTTFRVPPQQTVEVWFRLTLVSVEEVPRDALQVPTTSSLCMSPEDPSCEERPSMRVSKEAVLQHDQARDAVLASVVEKIQSQSPGEMFVDFESIFSRRKGEADEFYAVVQPPHLSEEDRRIQRQAWAGILWSKKFYHYGVSMWLHGDPAHPPPPPQRSRIRNHHWRHFYSCEVVPLPDAWEYPFIVAWDLCFHVLPLAIIDPEWSKRQMLLMLREWYMHPSGQIPAYEWDFGDVNPPVHAWAALRVYQITSKTASGPDIDFLERAFHKLTVNFTWWVNQVDRSGNNLFEGGFLGLDNISVFDRSAGLEDLGVSLEQADGSAWMAFYCLSMLNMAIELAQHRPVYEDVATKFFEHFVAIAYAMAGRDSGDGGTLGMWDEVSGFFYDLVRLKGFDGNEHVFHLQARSYVGLIPILAVATMEQSKLDRMPKFLQRVDWFLEHRRSLVENHMFTHLEPGICFDVAPLGGEATDRPSQLPHTFRGSRGNVIVRTADIGTAGASCGNPGKRVHLLSLVDPAQLHRVLERMLDPDQFLSDFGVRSLSKEHEGHPVVFEHGDFRGTLQYEPAESRSHMFGGNSNWRGPVWWPINYLVLESLQHFDHFFADTFRVRLPASPPESEGESLWTVAQDLAQRLIRLFRRDPTRGGPRPADGEAGILSTHPEWQDSILFHEFFHGDSGAGLGASHQTGWTALVAKLIQQQSAHH